MVERKTKVVWLGCAAGACLLAQAVQAAPVSWTFEDSPLGPPYANTVPGGGSLQQDAGTSAAGNGPGYLSTNSTHIQFISGTSTRLFSDNAAAVQADSFQFSFDMNPQFFGDFDNILGKEGSKVGVGGESNGEYINWQVHLLGDGNNNDLTQMEFVVRGETDGFAAVVTSEIIPQTGYDPLGNPQWTHVAGSYNATTGALSLVLTGAINTSVSGFGDAGLVSSNGGTLFLGTGGHNGSGYTAFAANTYIDNLAMVPEPATLSMLGVGLIGLLARRRRVQ